MVLRHLLNRVDLLFMHACVGGFILNFLQHHFSRVSTPRDSSPCGPFSSDRITSLHVAGPALISSFVVLLNAGSRGHVLIRISSAYSPFQF
jgi:hypothetical protein